MKMDEPRNFEYQTNNNNDPELNLKKSSDFTKFYFTSLDYSNCATITTPDGITKYSFDKSTTIPPNANIIALDPDTIGVVEYADHVPYWEKTISQNEDKKDEYTVKYRSHVPRLRYTFSSVNKVGLAKQSIGIEDLTEYKFYPKRYKGEYDRAYKDRTDRENDFEFINTTVSTIFSETGINHFEFTWEQKVYLSEIVRNVNMSDITNFGKYFGVSGFLVILGNDISNHWAKEVLKFDKNDRTREVFNTFGSLLFEYNKVFSFIKETTTKDSVSTYVADIRFKINEEILNVLADLIQNGGDIQLAYKHFLEKNQQLFLLKVILKENYIESLNELRNSQLDIVKGSSISETDISAMCSIYSRNQKDSAVHDSLLENFNKRIKDPNTKLYIFKWQEKIQSFVVFNDEHKDGSSYMSGFNVSPDARGHKIGEAMLDQVVEQEAKEHVLTADCDSKLPISAKYIETGWVGTFYWEDKNEKAGKSDWVLDIKRDENINQRYWGKSQTKEAIMTQRVHPETVKVEVAKSQAELPFHLLQEGYVLTRMFKNEGLTGGLYYGVFEILEKSEDSTLE